MCIIILRRFQVRGGQKALFLPQIKKLINQSKTRIIDYLISP